LKINISKSILSYSILTLFANLTPPRPPNRLTFFQRIVVRFRVARFSKKASDGYFIIKRGAALPVPFYSDFQIIADKTFPSSGSLFDYLYILDAETSLD